MSRTSTPYIPKVGIPDPRSVTEIMEQDGVKYRTALRRRSSGPAKPEGRERTLDYKTMDKLLQAILRGQNSLSLVDANRIAEKIPCERRAVYRRAAELKKQTRTA